MELIPLNWSAPKRVQTRMGERNLRTAAANETFWALWKTSKSALSQAGYSVSKRNGAWEVQHWASLDPNEMAKKAEAREESRAVDANVVVPAPAGLDYFGYQKAGIKFMSDRKSTLLGDDMGTGKTIQFCGLLNMTKPQQVLIICPASLRLMWRDALTKWLTYPINITVLTSKEAWPQNPGIVILNYDILGRFHDELRSVEWDVLGADEAHALKNDKAKRTQEVFGKKNSHMAIPAKRRVLMTGTPLLNRPIELFSLLNYLDPSRWTNRHKFAVRYCNAHHNGFGWDYSGASNLEELQNYLRESVMIRRTKDQVLTDLPPKTRQIVTLPSDLAAQAVKKEQATLAAREDELMRLTAALKLAEASGDPGAYKDAVARLQAAQAVAFEEMAKLRHMTALAKVPAVVDIIKDASGKVVIMAHHHDVIDALVEALGRDQTVHLTGQDSMEDRNAAVQRFQSDPACLYFVGSMKAAGVGLTLTASSHVVFAELDWVPGIVTQAEDRCHRIGQRNNVLVQHIVLDGSIDAQLAKTLVSKQAIIDAVLDKGAQAPAIVDTQPSVLPYDWARDWEAADLQLKQEAYDLMMKKEAEKTDRHVARIDAALVSRGVSSMPLPTLSDDQISAAHEGVQLLSGWDRDRATQKNDIGFNKPDGMIGHALAAMPVLTAKQAQLARIILGKYRRQLGDTLYTRIYP